MSRLRGFFIDPAFRARMQLALVVSIIVLVVIPAPATAADNGFVAVSSIPPGGRIFIDGNYQGMASWKGPVASGQHTLMLTLPGFQEYETSFVLYPSETKEFSVTMIPLPMLSFSSDPVNAEVYINGAYSADTNFEYGRVPAGSRFSIMMKKDGYKTYSTTITVSGDTLVHADLVPLDAQGSIAVYSNPSDARVIIDDIAAGTTPYLGMAVPGIHNVKITKPDYEEYSMQVSVENGKTASVTAILFPLQQDGTISIHSIPSGASVSVDGTFAGAAPVSIPVSPGSHTVRVALPGYTDHVVTIPVSAGQTQQLSITLIPGSFAVPATIPVTPGPTMIAATTTTPQQATMKSRMPEGTGSIAMVSYPDGANTYVDGAFAGKSPARMDAIPAGPHAVIFTLNGYADFTTRVQVTADETINVTARMVPVGQEGTVTARTTETPGFGLLISILGISTLIFLGRE